MKYTTLASLAIASLSLAQSLSDLPACATACLDDAVKHTTTCSASDLACICKNFSAIQGAAAGCVLGACGKDVALNKVLPMTQELCAKTGGGGNAPIPEPGNSVTVRPQPVTSLATTPATTASASASASPTPTASTGSPTATAGAAAVVDRVGGGLAMVVLAGGLALL
ncbi:hypothetical protein E4U41_005316 [Claviceps citrina]|nr:hypothetical protein E4U41_005316 [Claviceps citrina]